jgi:hypothetical protein
LAGTSFAHPDAATAALSTYKASIPASQYHRSEMTRSDSPLSSTDFCLKFISIMRRSQGGMTSTSFFENFETIQIEPVEKIHLVSDIHESLTIAGAY